MTKTFLKKKKCKKAKWLSEEALQIAEKRRDGKGKLEKERYTHLNAESQRIARRHKKETFFSPLVTAELSTFASILNAILS